MSKYESLEIMAQEERAEKAERNLKAFLALKGIKSIYDLKVWKSKVGELE